jgi:Flp pilus assembly protein TadG
MFGGWHLPKALHRWGAAVWGCARGATAVEFALVAPLFLVMTMGVVEVGRVLWIKATMQHAMEQTTRYFMVNNASCVSDLVTCRNTLAAYAVSRLEETGMSLDDFNVAADETTINSTTYMSISATYSYTPIVQIVQFPDVSLSALAQVPYNP